MFNDADLIEHLDNESSISVEAGCFLEINQNDPTNIDTIGCFKWGTSIPASFNRWPADSSLYIRESSLTSDMLLGTVEDDTIYFGGNIPKNKYFNLADCLTEFRPRSGIMKAVQPFTSGQAYVDDFLTVRRPRYYIPTVNDQFKYWTSWNTAISSVENRVGLSDANGLIRNAAPFVVYTEAVATNMITVKMQTSNGERRRIPFRDVPDPLADITKSTFPRRWSIEYLNLQGTWTTAMHFGNYDPSILGTDGTIDIVYMIDNPYPTIFNNGEFVLKGYLATIAHLPYRGRRGEAFVIGRDADTMGKIVVWDGAEWLGAEDIENAPDVTYNWKIFDYTMNPEEYAVREFINVPYYRASTDNSDIQYSEFVAIMGLRIVVDEMVAAFRSFDLIEMSPRLFCNMSKYVISYSIEKSLSSDSTLPIGDMAVSNGSITLTNMDLLLNKELKFDPFDENGREGSLLSGKIRKNSKFRFYEIVRGVPSGTEQVLYDKFIPVKTLYATEKPETISGVEDVEIELRDLTFYFEEKRCPNIVLKECSLTKAVATILDFIGFSNYIFHLGSKESYFGETSPFEIIIPYFFTNETQSVASTLEQLSIATQCAMFFDENNNFVVMPREHFNREPSYIFRGGSSNPEIQGLRANIESLDDYSVDLICDAEIKFTARDLARTGSMRMDNPTASVVEGEEGNKLVYKVNQLWDAGQLSNEVLACGVLRTSLTEQIPVYDPTVTDRVRNNSLDIGYWAQWFESFNGLIHMNGEIIRYDAKEYNIGGQNVWVNSREHLEELKGRSSFTINQPGTNTSMKQRVYATGRLRIYTEIFIDDNGVVSIGTHGRGMYGTTPVFHSAEPTEWLINPTLFHRDTAIDTVFGAYSTESYRLGPTTKSPEYTNDVVATNYIFNSTHSKNSPVALNPIKISPTDLSSYDLDRRIMRSSALTLGGPSNAPATHVYKKIKSLPGNGYTLFGCRMGIIGNESVTDTEHDKGYEQSAHGGMVLGEYTLDGGEERHTIVGAGGGLLFNTSRLGSSAPSNDGYYFELQALNASYQTTGPSGVEGPEVVFANMNFYKINNSLLNHPDLLGTDVAVKLWSGYMDIRVTSGSQMFRDRLISDSSLVYDIAIEMKEMQLINKVARKFVIYVNNSVVAVVEDTNSQPSAPGGSAYHPITYGDTEVGVFVRGRSVVQFEHIYAVGTNRFDLNTNEVQSETVVRPAPFTKFSPSAMWSQNALYGGEGSQWRYFEEFGSLARECRKLTATYDLYPALRSKIADTLLLDRAFVTTHFTEDSYGATMMVWSHADRPIKFGEPSSLIIHGLTFADNSEQTLKLDDILTGRNDGALTAGSYHKGIDFRNKLLAQRVSASTLKIDFESMYIQNSNDAQNLMRWLLPWMGQELISVSISAFAVPHIQIGDIVTIDYDIPLKIEKNVPIFSNSSNGGFEPDMEMYKIKNVSFNGNKKRFIVKRISINRDNRGPQYSIDLDEIPSAIGWNENGTGVYFTPVGA